MSESRLLQDFDSQLKEQAPSYVRQVVVHRDESSPRWIVSFEVLFSKAVTIEGDPGACAAMFWAEWEKKVKGLFGEVKNT